MTGDVSLIMYRGLTGALAPVFPVLLRRRLRLGKEEAARIAERSGHASAARPEGVLLWIHAASVGESIAILPLVSRLLDRAGRSVLVTTGTVTSAELMRRRLPPNALHQYAPLDLRANVRRFLDHWRPDLALFVESELWPNLLLEAQRREIPLALINARISARSFSGWSRLPGFSRRIFSTFDICLAQDETIAQRLLRLGARNVRIAGNLKADAAPLPADEAAVAALRKLLANRPVFLAASIHPGEDEAVLSGAAALAQNGWLTIIVPRHPERGADINWLARNRGLVVAWRSTGEAPTAATQVYIADTMGELGLFYRLATVAFLGGSLIPHGGQNPLEAARFAVPVLAGPNTENFQAIYDTLFAAQGMGRIRSADELVEVVRTFQGSLVEAKRIGELAREAADSLAGALDTTVAAAEQLLAHAHP